MIVSNEIKAKVFGQYLGQPIVIVESGINTPATLEGIDYSRAEIISERVNWNPDQIKLLLKPLSQISDEDAIEVAKIVYPFNDEEKWSEDMRTISEGLHIINQIKKDDPDTFAVNYLFIKYLQVFQFLQSRGYDLPQFLLNGKTLIESNLAIDINTIK